MEAGHPLKPDIQRQLYMDQSNISHIVKSFWWEGNQLKGFVEAANTARGNDFDGLVRQGCKVGFSLRAVGPITERHGDTVTVKDPLTIFSYDWIIHPSHAAAYMTDIISEGVDSSIIANLCESFNPIFEPIYEDATKYIIESSRQLNIVAESMGINISEKIIGKDIMITENAKNIIIKDGDDTFVVNTEIYLENEINSHLLNLKGQIKNEGLSFFGRKDPGSHALKVTRQQIYDFFDNDLKKQSQKIDRLVLNKISKYPELKSTVIRQAGQDNFCSVYFDPYKDNPKSPETNELSRKCYESLYEIMNELRETLPKLFKLKITEGDWDDPFGIEVKLNLEIARAEMLRKNEDMDLFNEENLVKKIGDNLNAGASKLKNAVEIPIQKLQRRDNAEAPTAKKVKREIPVQPKEPDVNQAAQAENQEKVEMAKNEARRLASLAISRFSPAINYAKRCNGDGNFNSSIARDMSRNGKTIIQIFEIGCQTLGNAKDARYEIRNAQDYNNFIDNRFIPDLKQLVEKLKTKTNHKVFIHYSDDSFAVMLRINEDNE